MLSTIILIELYYHPSATPSKFTITKLRGEPFLHMKQNLKFGLVLDQLAVLKIYEIKLK